MAELYDKEGNPVEALTTEEFEEKKTEAINEAVENYKKEHPEDINVTKMQEDLNAVNAELTKKNEEIELLGGTNKGKNVAALRESKEKLEKSVKDLEQKLEKEIGGIKLLVEVKSLNDTIDKISDGDVEIAKKIKFHYARNVKTEDNEEERRKKLGEAYVLATGGGNSDVLKSVLGASGAPNIGAIKGIEGFSPELVGLASKLGISQEDLKNPKLVKQK